MEKNPILKIITRETFEKALASGNYSYVSPEADTVIKGLDKMDLVELVTERGSALKVLSARKIDEERFAQVLCRKRK